MSTDNGTPYATLGQFAGVSARVNVALPKALKQSGLDIKTIIRHTDNGEKLSCALAEAFKMLHNGDARITIMPKEGVVLRELTSGLIIPACDGTETLAKADDVFAWRDSDFKNWNLDKPVEGTKEMAVDVYEMVKDATFAQMVDFFGVGLSKLCLTQHQIKVFCKIHRNGLRIGGFSTFFLFKDDDQFFVAGVDARSDGWRVLVHHFEDAYVWGAGGAHRIVVPQLAA